VALCIRSPSFSLPRRFLAPARICLSTSVHTATSLYRSERRLRYQTHNDGTLPLNDNTVLANTTETRGITIPFAVARCGSCAALPYAATSCRAPREHARTHAGTAAYTCILGIPAIPSYVFYHARGHTPPAHVASSCLLYLCLPPGGCRTAPYLRRAFLRCEQRILRTRRRICLRAAWLVSSGVNILCQVPSRVFDAACLHFRDVCLSGSTENIPARAWRLRAAHRLQRLSYNARHSRVDLAPCQQPASIQI